MVNLYDYGITGQYDVILNRLITHTDCEIKLNKYHSYYLMRLIMSMRCKITQQYDQGYLE